MHTAIHTSAYQHHPTSLNVAFRGPVVTVVCVRWSFRPVWGTANPSSVVVVVVVVGFDKAAPGDVCLYERD